MKEQTAEEFLASVGELGDDQAVKAMFGQVDLLDVVEAEDLQEVAGRIDYDPEDDYHNEQQASGLHPAYAGFDDPDSEDDEDYLWIE